MANDDSPKSNNEPGSGGKPSSSGGAKKKAPAPKKQAPTKAGGTTKKTSGGQSKKPPNKGGTTKAQAAMARQNAAKPKRRQTLIVWGTVALVLVLVIVLIVVKATGGGSPSSAVTPPTTSLPATIAKQVTSIPASVYNTVGVTASANEGYPKPVATSGQDVLTYKDSQGNSLPGVFFLGAEFCPYCAAERWSMAAAMSRFGTLTGLKATTSSCTDTDPCTKTLSFRSLKFESQYLVLRTIEQLTNQPNGSGGYTNLQPLSGADAALVQKYESANFLGSWASPDSFPFINFGNQFLVAGPIYDPAVLKGQSRSEIASNLTDPNNPATQAIVATANYMTAATCVITKDKPADVCNSKGVMAANTSLGIKK